MTHTPNDLPATPTWGRRHRGRAIGRATTAIPGPSVDQYLTSWLAGRQNLRPATRLVYELHLRRYLRPHLGHIRLAALTLEQVEAMYAAIATTPDRTGLPPRPTTVRCIHATLMSALNFAVRRGALERNPATHVELPRAQQPRMTTWTATQLATFLDTAAAHELCPLFVLMALTGLRRGEAIGLRWIDVDLAERTLRVEQQIVAVAGERHTGPPKSAHGRRTVAVPASLAAVLQAHRGRQRVAQDSAGAKWVNTGLVFTTATGTALDPAFVSRQFDRLVTASGLPRIRLHGLRHTSASLGLASGESLLEVSRRLGHSSITITADVYSDVTPATARHSAERLDTLIGASTTRPRH